MADRSLTVRVGANVTGLVSGMKTAAKAMTDASTQTDQWVQKNRQGISDVSNLMLGIGAGATAAAGLAVMKFAEFDQAMSSVVASGDDARESQDALRQAALDAGADTVFSATESANAIEEMAKAGVSAQDILSGGLTGALDLAAAGSLGVADAAEIASTVMNQFNLTGEDTVRIADVLAASAGKANGEVADFGLAMKYVGPVAAQLGVSLEETSGTLALLAQNGLLADSAGTGLRGVLMSLTAPTKAAQKAMDEYGISAFDAQGEFVGLESLAGQLSTKLGGLTEAERSAALGRMFGNEQITTARILYAEGASAVADWTAQVNDSGYAAETAATKLDNLMGDWEAFTGALDTALINAGSAADGPLRTLVQTATAVVDEFGEMPGGVQSATMAIVGGGGLVALGVGGMGKLAVGISDARAAFDTFGTRGKVALVGISGALAIATVAFGAWATAQAEARARTEEFMGTLDELGGRTNETLRSINEQLSAKPTRDITNLLGDTDSAIEQAKSMGIAVEDLTGYVLGQADAVARVNAAMTDYSNEDLGNLWNPGAKASTVEDLRSQIDGLAGSLSESEKQKLREIEANEALGVSTGELAGDFEAAAGSGDLYVAAQEEATKALEDWITEVSESDASFISLLGGYDSIIAKSREAAEQQAADTKSTEDSWEDFYDGVSVSMEEYLVALEEQVAAQQNWETNMLLLSGRVSQGVIDELARLGPEGAPLVADLVDASDEELARLETVYGERSTTATNAFADNLRNAGPVLAAVMRVAGEDAADAAAAALAAGETDLQSVIAQYDLEVELGASTSHAQTVIDMFVSEQSKRVIQLNVSANTGSLGPLSAQRKAGGGFVSGPGSGTSDSIPAYLSNGEFVVKASSVAKYGTALMHEINAGRYAKGGEVTWANARPVQGSFAPSVATAPTVMQGPTYNIRVEASGDRAADAAMIDKLAYELRALDRGGRYNRG